MLNAALQNVNKLKEIATQYHWMKNRICTMFALCKPVENINFAKICTHCISGVCQVCTKCANLATTAYAMGANLNKVDICYRFAQDNLCKFDIRSLCTLGLFQCSVLAIIAGISTSHSVRTSSSIHTTQKELQLESKFCQVIRMTILMSSNLFRGKLTMAQCTIDLSVRFIPRLHAM